MRGALATAFLVMAVGSPTACGASADSGGGKVSSGSDRSALSTGEALFLETLKGRSSPDWEPWPSDSELLAQGYKICKLLSTPGLMRNAVVVMMDPIPDNMSTTSQANWEIDTAEVTICEPLA